VNAQDHIWIFVLVALRTPWPCHYNAEMPGGGVIRSTGKSFMMTMIILGSFCISQPAAAQGTVSQGSPAKPDAAKPALATLPTTQPATPAPPPHAFWDRTNLALFSGIAVTRGVDYASTRNFQARGRQEILLPDDVVNNSAGFASLEAAATLTSIGISYLLHRTGHHRLERWISIGHIGVTAFGDVRNYSLESRHRPR
jgi:hypothetical protein